MSDSDELLFGNITDADSGGENKVVNGTSYPQRLTTIAMDSDSDSFNPSHSNDPIQIKKSKSFKRDKSRKRIKDIIMNQNEATNSTIIGEAKKNNNNDNNNDFVDIDPSSISPIHSNNDIGNNNSSTKKSKKNKKKKGFLLNGNKSKNKDHHILSDKDSDDEDDDEYEYDNENISCQDIIISLKENGHLVSIILTLIIIITLFTCFTGKLAAIIIFIIFYLIYLCECYVNKTWKQMRMSNKTDFMDGNIKLLEVMRKTAPVIDWYVECYHYETLNMPQTEAKTIIWVHGKIENGNHFQELGFNVKYFKWDWNAIEFVSNKQNQTQIAAIILPSGYQGNRIRKAIISKFKHIHDTNDNNDDEKVAMQIDDDDDDMDTDMDTDMNMDIEIDMNENDDLPLFFGWNGDINKLLMEFEDSNIIKQDRKKIVTHTNSMIYDYNKWNDISLNYPNFNRYEITKLQITKQYCLLNEETRNDFNQQKQEFLSFNNRDELQSFHEKIDIRGFKNCIIINKNNNNNNNKPFWYTIHGYWILSILLCTLYPRYKCCTMFGKANWKLIKSISI